MTKSIPHVQPTEFESGPSRPGVARPRRRSPRTRHRLVALRALLPEPTEAFVDVRGWRVTSSDGAIVGSVIRILLDTSRDFRVRYIDVLLDPELDDTADGGIVRGSLESVLIPIGLVEIPLHRHGLLLPTLTRARVAALPRLPNGSVTLDYEQRLASAVEIPSADTREGLYSQAIYSSAQITTPLAVVT